MNGRILELAKNPDQFQIKDLELLSSEINKHPYIQSLRALHLLGTHRLKPENYANELSITAAYTTDKKILYQLINASEELKPAAEIVSQTIIEKENATEPINKFTEITSKVKETPKAVYVNGELNRILFEGEEDFLERETETIDLESTLESGQIVIQKAEEGGNKTKNEEFSQVKDAQTFSEETVIIKEIIAEEIPIAEGSNKINFNGAEDFLPEVKIIANPEKAEVQEIAKPALNKREEEMKRLIAEVEAKMKVSKKEKKTTETKEESTKSTEINFSETQNFELPKAEENTEEKPKLEADRIEKTVPLTEQKTEIQPIEIRQKPIELKTESIIEEKPEWKPMSFSTNTPDALISKEIEITQIKKEEIKPAETFLKTEEKPAAVKEENQSADRPVFNVSFFTQNVSALEKENKLEETQPIETEKKTAELADDSNVPNFINTWQSWLKIDRNKQDAKEKIEITITEIKNKVIENFIEKEPRISKLKEESDFVIKERNDDISHLMTETLANLYTEQKLYAKAIKAYGILSAKHPEKKSHFDVKIQQIKELRQNK